MTVDLTSHDDNSSLGMIMPHDPSATRRTFLKAAGAAALAAPMVRADDKSGSKPPILGEGEHKYEAVHGWGKLPGHIRWGETHGVAVGKDGSIYIKHRSTEKEPMDAIVVFDPEGKYVYSFGQKYHGGGHGIDIREEGGTEYLYLSDVQHNIVDKTTKTGAVVWTKGRPAEVPLYADPAAKYVPTNVAFAPDGGFYIADGYGSSTIQRYDKDGKLIGSFGGFGGEIGQFKTPHGLMLDDRPGREPVLVVADRANARLQSFTLDGKPAKVDHGVSFPAHFDIRGDVLLVPDLHARVTLMDRDNKVITHLGYDPEWTKQALDGFKMRSDPSRWRPGRFIHPHDACFDKDGNIYVVEWVATGRVSRLRKLA